MKKTITILAVMISLSSFGQKKDTIAPTLKDTTIQLLLPLNQYRALLYTIDQNIDSKKISKELLEFLQKSAMIYQPAEKPKK